MLQNQRCLVFYTDPYKQLCFLEVNDMSVTDSTSQSPLPPWQLLLLLVGFPLLYMLNSLTPWARGLFVEHQRSSFLPFWGSVAILHWTSLVLAVVFVRRSGRRMSDLDFRMTLSGMIIFVIVTVGLGLVLVMLRKTWPTNSGPAAAWQVFYPHSLTERLFWVFMCLTASFCEEFVYRGFGIRMLQCRRFRTWQAVALCCVSFVFVHGAAGVLFFPAYFIVGLLFSLIFLWRKSLAPGMYLHAVFDLLALLAV